VVVRAVEPSVELDSEPVVVEASRECARLSELPPGASVEVADEDFPELISDWLGQVRASETSEKLRLGVARTKGPRIGLQIANDLRYADLPCVERVYESEWVGVISLHCRRPSQDDTFVN
jgi:hypothetical protein